MASARKKQDEKNLKIVRELVSLPPNKFCFDCSQRGPTYVNVTIGSFVCTKCSGLLRGLTPPHRVKSISMTTFTTEEVDLMRSRGNEYCRRVWLGLHDGKLAADGGAWDEHAVHQLMLDKYDRKRFYIEPSASSAMANNVSTASVVQHNNQINNTLYSETNTQQASPSKTILRPPVSQHLNNNNNIILRKGAMHGHRNRTTSSSSASQPQQQQHMDNGDFVADFDHADIFSSNNNNAIVNGNGYSHGSSNGNGVDTGFANFDNNPAFKNMNFPLASSSNGSAKHTATPPPPHRPPVTEDKYAALKDLDQSLHQSNNAQPTTAATALDWGGSTSSLYSSATSPLSSSYGSPTTAPHFNPFNATSTNGGTDMWSNNVFDQQSFFSSPQPVATVGGTSMLNGHMHGTNGQPSLFGGVGANTHTNGVASSSASSANPFGVSGGNGGFVASFPPLSSNVSSASVMSNGMSGHMTNGGGGNAALSNTAWNCQNPFKLASNGNTKNPFL